jgi:hypothetical protein
MVAKNLSTFCLFPEPLWEPEFKGDKPVSLVEEISRQLSIQDVAWLLLLLLARFTVRIGSKKQSTLKNAHSDQKKEQVESYGQGGCGCKETGAITKS